MPSKEDLEKALRSAESELKSLRTCLKNETDAGQKKFYEGMISTNEKLIAALKKRIKEIK
jgi:hypothetical protein